MHGVRKGGQATVFLLPEEEIVIKVFDRNRSYVNEVSVLTQMDYWNSLHSSNLQQMVLMPLCKDDQRLMLVFPHASEGDLSRLIRRRSAMDVSDLIHQLVRAVQLVHEAGFVHMDVKPENIVVHRDQLRLIDMGLSISIDVLESNRSRGRLVGTKRTMAPEVLLPMQLGKTPVGIWSDWWSVGVTIYYILTNGEYPYDVRSVMDESTLSLIPWMMQRDPLRMDLDVLCWKVRWDLMEPFHEYFQLLFSPIGLLASNVNQRCLAANRLLA